MRLVGYSIEHRPADPRFANPCLADQQHALALARLGLRPALQEQRQLLVAPDHRQERRSAHRFEPALDRPLGLDRERPDRLADAFELALTQGLELKAGPKQPPRRIGDHHLAGGSSRLQARCKIRSVADHRLLLRGTLADQIADHHEAGCDADPSGQSLARRRLQLADRFGERQSRPNRPLRFVLVRPRIPEVGQHTVAHELGDEALEPGDHPGAGVLIRPDHLAHVLGIEPRRQLGRADQVDEHHRQLPPLGLRS